MRPDEADVLLARLAALTALLDRALLEPPQGGAPTKEVTMPFANVPAPTTPDHPDAPGVRVQWGRDCGTVQLVVLPFESGMPTEQARADERHLWANLDRRGCNELIRQLRQARDDAFGADA